jgi:tRNA A-37 threonylcarbamoyl transferase component Bud32
VPVSGKPGQVLPESGMTGQIAEYRLDALIGQGAMAAVYLAWDKRHDRKVALKVIAPELAGDTAFRARFLRESQAAAAVDHPHIIPVYEAGDASGTLYVAMRYVEGGDVRSLLNRVVPFPLDRAWAIIAQVASALDAAHAHGLVHRDVRPASMLLDAGAAAGRTPGRADDSNVDHVYLSDFGISKNSLSGEITATGQFEGTLDYLAPEQIEGRPLDGRADLYSLACAGFELLCGTPPFGQDQGLTVMFAQLYAPPPMATARRADLPAAVDLVLATALAKDPADRYASSGQFAEELHKALGLGPGASGRPARQAPAGHAGMATEVRPPSGEKEPARQHEIEIAAAQPGGPAEPAAPAQRGGPAQPGGPAQSEPLWPWSSEEQLPAGDGQASTNSMAELAGGYPRPPRWRPGARPVLAAAAVLVIVAAVAVGVVLSMRTAPGRPAASSAAASPSPSSSPSPSPSPSRSASPAPVTSASGQAAALNRLLGSSAATRQALQNAVNEVRNCASLPGAVSQIQAVVNQRSTENSQASALSTTALANGAAVKSDLIAAMRSSLDADREYLTWARQQMDSGCTPTAQSGAYNAANQADQQAGTSKAAFVQVWNPVAARYGFQQKSPASI